MPSSARAWRIHRLGPPEAALQLDAVTVRDPGPGEATVAIAAVGLNFPDLLLCSGRYQEQPELPFAPGFEGAGTVVAAGRDCGVAEGERVIVVPELPAGALQERVTLPGAQLFPLGEGRDAVAGATLHVAYATAHMALHRRAGLRAGETVLVHGGAGGVGSAAIQLARAAGARVIATASGAERLAACRRAGAGVLVDAGDPGLADAVRAATGGRGADVVVDVVGGDVFDRSRRCVAFEGRMVVVGFTGGEIPLVPANHVLLRNYAVVGLHLAAYRREDPALLRAVHDDVLRLWDEGAIAPVVGRTLPFEAAPAGLRLIADRAVAGRVVLRT